MFPPRPPLNRSLYLEFALGLQINRTMCMLVRPEVLLLRHARFPVDYISAYLETQDHFNLGRLVRTKGAAFAAAEVDEQLAIATASDSSRTHEALSRLSIIGDKHEAVMRAFVANTDASIRTIENALVFSASFGPDQDLDADDDADLGIGTSSAGGDGGDPADAAGPSDGDDGTRGGSGVDGETTSNDLGGDNDVGDHSDGSVSDDDDDDELAGIGPSGGLGSPGSGRRDSYRGSPYQAHHSQEAPASRVDYLYNNLRDEWNLLRDLSEECNLISAGVATAGADALNYSNAARQAGVPGRSAMVERLAEILTVLRVSMERELRDSLYSRPRSAISLISKSVVFTRTTAEVEQVAVVARLVGDGGVCHKVRGVCCWFCGGF